MTALTVEPSAPATFVELLERRGIETPDKVLLIAGTDSFTYAEVLAEVRSLAEGLVALGLEPGDRVAILAANSPQNLFVWLAIGFAGGIDIPINVAARGRSLTYLLNDASPRFVVLDPERAAEWSSVVESGVEGVEKAIALPAGEGDDRGSEREPSGTALAGTEVVSYAELRRAAGGPLPSVRTGDHATIMYTSGTTGPPKGVMLPHGYYGWYGEQCARLMGFSASGRLFCAQPLFHIDGRVSLMAALAVRGTLVLSERFSVRNFWREIDRQRCTHFFYVGSMLWMLYKESPPREERATPLVGFGSAAPVEVFKEFEQRFQTRLLDGFGMTEAVLVSAAPVREHRPGTMGRPLPWIGGQLVDDQGEAVGSGKTGEIVLRPQVRNIFPLGYWRQAEETVRAWRDLLFHTGDLAIADDEGYWTYQGRIKDSIRRRGENVSAWEIERCFLNLDSVKEAAAFGVPAAVGDEEIAILLVLGEGVRVAASDVWRAAARDLPYFMVPRFIEFVDELPKTPSLRVEKSIVKARGVTAQAWDALSHGFDARSVEL